MGVLRGVLYSKIESGFPKFKVGSIAKIPEAAGIAKDSKIRIGNPMIVQQIDPPTQRLLTFYLSKDMNEPRFSFS